MSIKQLQSQSYKNGVVSWIGIRPARGAEVVAKQEIVALEGLGLAGDHYLNPGGQRQLTLIQAEHLDTIASFLSLEKIHPSLTRRNIVIRGFNLLSLKGQEFFIGDCRFRYSGDCHPCSRMEKNLGTGGYHAMRGLGGITCVILKGGMIRVGDQLRVVDVSIS